MDFLLAQDTPATPAQPVPETGPGPGQPAQNAPGSSLFSLLPFVLMAVVFWFVLIRPQRRQEKERQKRVDALKRGDRVRTRGGIVGPVVRVKDDEVILGLGGDRALEVAIHKSYIDDVYGAEGKPSGDAK